MKKEQLSKFIEKYHLAGTVNSVKIEVKNKGLECAFVSQDQNMVGNVKAANFELDDATIGIYQTAQLVKLLGALDSEIDLNIKQIDGKSVTMNVKDTDTQVNFILSDLSVIEDAPTLQSLPGMDVEVVLSKDFITKFIRSKNSLPEATNFAVQSDGTNTDIILNYSTIQSNSIKFSCESIKAADMSPISFSANHFKEILTANKGCDSGKLEISAQGLAKITFTEGDYESEYYLVQLQNS